MDDLMQTLQQAMQDPNTMAAVRRILGSGNSPKEETPPEQNETGGVDISALAGLQQAFSKMNTEDDTTRLIRALRPHLRPERQKRADEAIRMLRLFSLLPVLSQSGLLQEFFGREGE